MIASYAALLTMYVIHLIILAIMESTYSLCQNT